MATAIATTAQQPVWQPLLESWTEAPLLTQMVYDSWRQRSVAADGAKLTEFDRAAWQNRGSGTGWLNSAFAFDRARGVTVAFGGTQIISVDASTRVWNGTAWTQLSPPVSPPGRHYAAMAFDRARSRLVLFGGQSGSQNRLGDTWEFDGISWTQVASGGPAARYRHAMTWDPQRNAIVLFGGNIGGMSGDTWEWNGTTWTQYGSGPVGMVGAFAYDESRGRAVLLHWVSPGTTSSTWERIGTTWTLVEAISPMQAPLSGGCHDEVLGRVITSCPTAGAPLLRTWAWNGATWLPLTPALAPSISEGVSLVSCPVRNSVLRVGSEQSWVNLPATTWDWSAGRWEVVPTPTPQPPLGWPAAAAEPTGSVLLFGGTLGFTPQNATWRFTGSNWVALNPANSPTPRWQHGMALDPVAGRVVLFGGLDPNGGTLGDTWLWDGATWTQRFPVTSPPPRANAALAFDPNTNAMLLFGGGVWNGIGSERNDLWSWNGTTWQQRIAAGAPTPRARATMVYDPARQRIVVTGGFAYQWLGTNGVAGTWEWDGVSWTSLGGTQPPATIGFVGAFDEILGRVIAFTGSPSLPPAMWQLGAPSLAATAPFGSGCTGGSGAPGLTARYLPRVGNPRFALHATSLLPGTAALFGIDTTATNVPLGGGCTLLVGTPQLAFRIADAAGVARLSLPLPQSTALQGATIVAQAAAFDPVGPLAQFVFTPGLSITID